MISLGILGSTRGTNLSGLIDAIKQKKLAATINIVISNKADALILNRAAENDIPSLFIDPQRKSREEYDQVVSNALQDAGVELVVLIGYMRILSPWFTQTWSNKIINVHPSLLPAYAGMMDLSVHQAVLQAGDKETGCTVHYVTAEVDAGPAIVQKKCDVSPDDTAESLKAKVQSLEVHSLIEAIEQHAIRRLG